MTRVVLASAWVVLVVTICIAIGLPWWIGPILGGVGAALVFREE